MVDELRVLENISSLMQLSDRRVQRELAIDVQSATVIEDAIETFRGLRESLSNQYVGGLTSENAEMTELLHGFDSFITETLSPSQLTRLQQIARQRRLPFTFKSSEVVAILELTRQQRADINRIIEETRPNRGDGPPDRPGPPRRPGDGPGSQRRGGPQRRDSDPFGFGSDRRPPEMRDFERQVPDGPPPFGDGGHAPPFRDDMRRAATQKTVQAILEILTPSQRQTWEGLVGDSFEDSV